MSPSSIPNNRPGTFFPTKINNDIVDDHHGDGSFLKDSLAWMDPMQLEETRGQFDNDISNSMIWEAEDDNPTHDSSPSHSSPDSHSSLALSKRYRASRALTVIVGSVTQLLRRWNGAFGPHYRYQQSSASDQEKVLTVSDSYCCHHDYQHYDPAATIMQLDEQSYLTKTITTTPTTILTIVADTRFFRWARQRLLSMMLPAPSTDDATATKRGREDDDNYDGNDECLVSDNQQPRAKKIRLGLDKKDKESHDWDDDTLPTNTAPTTIAKQLVRHWIPNRIVCGKRKKQLSNSYDDETVMSATTDPGSTYTSSSDEEYPQTTYQRPTKRRRCKERPKNHLLFWVPRAQAVPGPQRYDDELNY